MTTSRTPVVAKRTSNLSTLLRQTAARLPGQVAIVRSDVEWSWADFDRRVDALAAVYADAGIGQGDVIMLHAPNSRDYLTVVFATWRVGAVITPTNCKLTPSEIAALADVVRPCPSRAGRGS